MFIVLEGLDGAGKSTQVELIKKWLEAQGKQYEYVHFPRFSTPIYGELIASFLRGELGSIENVDSRLVALLYAGDRAEAADTIRKWLSEGKVVIMDRYVYSNVAYQCAKSNKPEELKNWILDLEYRHNSIPRPDVSIFLDVPFVFTEKSLSTVRQGQDRDYLNGKQDIHEADLEFQRKVRQMYINCAEAEADLTIVNCCDPSNNSMLAPEIIFDKIKNIISVQSDVK